MVSALVGISSKAPKHVIAFSVRELEHFRTFEFDDLMGNWEDIIVWSNNLAEGVTIQYSPELEKDLAEHYGKKEESK